MPMRKLVLMLDMAQIAGAEMHVLSLLKSLNRREWDPELLILQPGPLVALVEQEGIPVHCLGWKRRLSLNGIRRLIRLLSEVSPDILHLHQPRAILFGALAGRLVGVPRVVATIHSSPEQFGFRAHSAWKRALIVQSHRVLERLSVMLVDRVITVSRAISERIRPLTVHKQCTQIYNGVELDQFRTLSREEARNRIGLAQGWRIIVSVGYIHPLKGYRELLEAFVVAAQRNPDLHWVIVGQESLPGFQRQLLERLEAVGLSLRVHFLGVRPDVPQILAAADLFALASRDEPFGRVFAEASAAGLPVVGTSVGGIPEIIDDGETGILVPVGSSEAIAEAIQRVLADPARGMAMGQAGQKHVTARFDQATVTRQTEAFYRA